jgi:hypothetical protein
VVSRDLIRVEQIVQNVAITQLVESMADSCGPLIARKGKRPTILQVAEWKTAACSCITLHLKRQVGTVLQLEHGASILTRDVLLWPVDRATVVAAARQRTRHHCELLSKRTIEGPMKRMLNVIA